MKNNPFLTSAMLAIEAQQVIGLRMVKFAFGGPAAQKEAKLMVDEKVTAVADAASLIAMATMQGRAGSGPADVLAMVRRRVRANRKRLMS